jgi:hypothetical protein|tara:strand:- start:2941 stop:3879 length:939 start_codon:yes stop_codon:yes gene_type:complete
MAFQDNSGDIILDTVLTDEGRRRLARGDGSFRIVKFALGDDEINYELYEYSKSTAQKDLTILQIPILEAFTNNSATMKSKLMTLSMQNLLYLPILKVNTVANNAVKTYGTDGNYVVATNDNTEDNKHLGLSTSIGYDSSGNIVAGVLFGQNPDQGGGYIKLDAGIDSTDVTTIDPSLVETQFQIEIDNRLGGICDRKGKTFLSPVSVDDDDIAIYIISKNSDPNFIFTPSQTNLVSRTSPIDGPLASTVEFKVVSSVAIRSSDYLFDRLGSTATYTNAGGTDSPTQIIDSIVRVSGLTTGYSVDLPVRFAKL